MFGWNTFGEKNVYMYGGGLCNIVIIGSTCGHQLSTHICSFICLSQSLFYQLLLSAVTEHRSGACVGKDEIIFINWNSASICKCHVPNRKRAMTVKLIWTVWTSQINVAQNIFNTNTSGIIAEFRWQSAAACATLRLNLLVKLQCCSFTSCPFVV